MTAEKMHLSKDLYKKGIATAATRDGYGLGLVELGKKNKNVVALCADLADSTRSIYFREKFPKRFVEVGVAEQNLVTVASGLAAVGKIPFAASFSVFCPGRCWEQIRTTICYNNRNVKIAGSHSGISVGEDGATHQSLEDIALMRALPNMVIVVPCDVNETKKATIAIGRIKKPAYIRFGREKTAVFTTPRTPFRLGRAEIFRQGSDVAIIACGSLVYDSLLAAKSLEKKGISAMVVNSHTVKPLDGSTLLHAARKTGAVVTVEEHQVTGGLGGAVSEFLSENYPVPLKRLGVNDRFGESGPPAALMEKYGLTEKGILRAAGVVLKLKK